MEAVGGGWGTCGRLAALDGARVGVDDERRPTVTDAALWRRQLAELLDSAFHFLSATRLRAGPSAMADLSHRPS